MSSYMSFCTLVKSSKQAREVLPFLALCFPWRFFTCVMILPSTPSNATWYGDASYMVVGVPPTPLLQLGSGQVCIGWIMCAVGLCLWPLFFSPDIFTYPEALQSAVLPGSWHPSKRSQSSLGRWLPIGLCQGQWNNILFNLLFSTSCLSESLWKPPLHVTHLVCTSGFQVTEIEVLNAIWKNLVTGMSWYTQSWPTHVRMLQTPLIYRFHCVLLLLYRIVLHPQQMLYGVHCSQNKVCFRVYFTTKHCEICSFIFVSVPSINFDHFLELEKLDVAQGDFLNDIQPFQRLGIPWGCFASVYRLVCTTSCAIQNPWFTPLPAINMLPSPFLSLSEVIHKI